MRGSGLTERDLGHWALLQQFRDALVKASAGRSAHPSFQDAGRLLLMSDYLSLFLFGLLNPVVRTMRALCMASDLERVRQEVCTRHVSLGSFSEAQHLLDPELLEKVFEDLAAQLPGGASGDRRLEAQGWLARDGSLFAALPRMSWALYGGGRGGKQNALRLHLSFNVLERQPTRAKVTVGRRCERAVWKEQWRAGDAYIGDRYFAENYQAMGELATLGCSYVLRLREPAIITWRRSWP